MQARKNEYEKNKHGHNKTSQIYIIVRPYSPLGLLCLEAVNEIPNSLLWPTYPHSLSQRL